MNIPRMSIEKLLAYCKRDWMRWVIGAIVGALATAGVITITGCTVSVDLEVVRYIITNPVDRSGK